jgi:hypothetical protein
MRRKVAYATTAIGVFKDWICYPVEFLVKITRVNTSALHNWSPALLPALISCSTGCSSSFILILWGVLGQIIL